MESKNNGKETATWFAMYAYKKEMLAQQALKKESIEHFVPMRHIIKERHGRREAMFVPAISNLIFVHATKDILTQFKIRNPYLQYITRKNSNQREIIIVPRQQMQEFIKVAQVFDADLTYFKPDEISLGKGTKVRVHGGAFDGVEGVLLKVKGKRSKRIVIKIPGIVAVAAAYVEPELIEIIS